MFGCRYVLRTIETTSNETIQGDPHEIRNIGGLIPYSI